MAASSRSSKTAGFAAEARRILDMPIAYPVNALGGYGPGGEVIYAAHPSGCPSILVDSDGPTAATFMSNGSVGLTVKLADGMEVSVLDGSFDNVEKRETGVPSQNVWLAIEDRGRRHVASLINPQANLGCEPADLRVVKLGDPNRAMWYCATFRPATGLAVQTAVRLSLAHTARGPALVREVFIRNIGRRKLAGSLWACFTLHGTQRFVYNKQAWYDRGLPLSLTETVVTATVPYSDLLQIKRVSSLPRGLRPVDATCDYATFVGDTSAMAALPQAVRRGRMLAGGAGRKLNRFSTTAVAANQFAVSLAPGASATLQQSLLYVTDAKIAADFRKASGSRVPRYLDLASAFQKAAKSLIARTPGAADVIAGRRDSGGAAHVPSFQVALPALPAAACYANSVWTGVDGLYENCRAHGARLAQGIELGTRDRAQDMWPKMKDDPGRVRADLVHAFSFMYVTCPQTPVVTPGQPMTLVEKLHGMFPRQYPSRWDDRGVEVANDNRPYADSPLWLVNALNMYLRETGDASILAERVGTVRLTNPDRPEQSTMVGADRTQTVAEAAFEVLACFQRHAEDSPYGMAQILYGDWCDPIDMFGTSVVGDATTRGRGRGVQTRMSAHVFGCLIETIDAVEAPAVAAALAAAGVTPPTDRLKQFAVTLRDNIIRVAWEDGPGDFPAGFIDTIHELNADGSTPDYAAGQTGYTLGSYRGRDADGFNRRVLISQAYGLRMLLTSRDWLAPVPQAGAMIARILRTTDTLFARPKLGLVLYTTMIPNNQEAIRLFGRMGLLPPGTAENGEYHHGQMFMHRYRLDVPGQADHAWRHFTPIMSAMRDASIGGPFETPCTSYASDPDDPHFGKGMYFGLSGQIDWIVELFGKLAGVELNLHDARRPALAVHPALPCDFADRMTFSRVIHAAIAPGRYRRVPLTVTIDRRGRGAKVTGQEVRINGKRVEKAELKTLAGLRRADVRITLVYGK